MNLVWSLQILCYYKSVNWRLLLIHIELYSYGLMKIICWLFYLTTQLFINISHKVCAAVSFACSSAINSYIVAYQYFYRIVQPYKHHNIHSYFLVNICLGWLAQLVSTNDKCKYYWRVLLGYMLCRWNKFVVERSENVGLAKEMGWWQYLLAGHRFNATPVYSWPVAAVLGGLLYTGHWPRHSTPSPLC